MFKDVEWSWPVSAHDSKAFANFSINLMLRNKEMPATFKTIIPVYEKIPKYLIGDFLSPYNILQKKDLILIGVMKKSWSQ